MSIRGADPVWTAGMQVIADAAQATWEAYKREMSILYRTTHGAYGYPFQGSTTLPESPVLEGQANSIERETETDSLLTVPRASPRNIHRSRQAHYRHLRRMGMRSVDAARISMEDEYRYRIGWNSSFSIMPLDAKGRPYARWPR